MGLIALLPEIDKKPNTVFVMHEKSEKLIPLHKHKKGQLSYVEGGLAYVVVDTKTLVVPPRHYFWIPKGVPHIVKVGHSATVFRSLYFYSTDDDSDPFYSQLGIYPASELLIQMIAHTERWDGRHISSSDKSFQFLTALKNLLPQLQNHSLPIHLPTTDDERLNKILKYLERSIEEKHSLSSVAARFNLSERTMSRLFQANLNVSFLQYLKSLRIIKALEMLLKTKKTISEIGYSVGYDSLGAFSNSFYMFTKLRPSDLRKKN
jgi:AraC-like DNA-binding protein/quercetin dioxygenase-like cupin family protein